MYNKFVDFYYNYLKNCTNGGDLWVGNNVKM